MKKKILCFVISGLTLACIGTYSLSPKADLAWWACKKLAANEAVSVGAVAGVGYVGSEAGAWAGAKIGAAIGAAGGPIGAGIGGFVGAVGGAL